ncbi:protein translocase subunit SecD [Oxynema aestuarii]|uniref:Protein translocase subunit SecD n=1 Tax=Oxynema aestuarii AP17 TaxID=2064643 RepID=A0A6H1TYD5_9CYAN|nr:protein translocase subunit SecD [Oxynema aestuarii]QIZ71594.1 protein translocase subunit SecD [Oxynema aestuarii AP17]RMH72760.1 MAG: protein translocase subunit SecD [Cyanobacteria bacterium J007]
MQKQRSLLALIAVLFVAAIVILNQVEMRLGLDLQGGSQLTIQVRPSEDVRTITPEVMEAVQSVVRNRVDGLGVAEPIVQTVGDDRILVQLPGISDPEQAERVLGGTAQLDFRKEVRNPELNAEVNVRRQELSDLLLKQVNLEQEGNAEAIEANKAAIAQKQEQINELSGRLYERTGLTGKNLEYADPQPAQAGNLWNVGLEFDAEGGRLFADLTKELAGTGRTLGIFLDDRLISSPVVGAEFAETGITGGRAVIQGRFTAQEANDLAVQLRGGALPVPVEIVENRTVGATLGRDSIDRSIYAGIGGLVLVLIFMAVYYRLPGVIADIALTIYAVLTLASFALLGVTLTLPGIAGFILSIGMAVDANVLIFERTREELRSGKSLYRSVESGFYRAFSSILDSNVTTLIACGALFWFGAGLVRGFALTLAIGVLVSMFTAITCSRSLMFFAIGIDEFRKPELFCPDLTTVNKA